MGSNADLYLGVVALLEACYVTNSGRHDAVGCHLVYQELEIRFKPREMVILLYMKNNT